MKKVRRQQQPENRKWIDSDIYLYVCRIIKTIIMAPMYWSIGCIAEHLPEPIYVLIQHLLFQIFKMALAAYTFSLNHSPSKKKTVKKHDTQTLESTHISLGAHASVCKTN